MEAISTASVSERRLAEADAAILSQTLVGTTLALEEERRLKEAAVSERVEAAELQKRTLKDKKTLIVQKHRLNKKKVTTFMIIIVLSYDM